MFTFILILLMVLPLAFFIGVVHLEPLVSKRKTQKQLAKKHEAAGAWNTSEQPRLSSFSKHILSEFRKIPSNSKPFSSEELIESLKALDVKFGIDEVDRHFTVPGYSYLDAGLFTTNCTYVDNYYTRKYSSKMRPHNCEFDEYQDLLKAITEVQAAVKAQEKALAISAVQPSLDAVKSLTDALRQETKIITTVTDELC